MLSVNVAGEHSTDLQRWWEVSQLYPSLGHIDDNGQPTAAYWIWRDRNLLADKVSPRVWKVRARPTSAVILWPRDPEQYDVVPISEARRVFASIYSRIARTYPEYDLLLRMISRGNNLLIIDACAPLPDEYPNGLQFDLAVYERMIGDPLWSFGSGAILAEMLLRDVAAGAILDPSRHIRLRDVEKVAHNHAGDPVSPGEIVGARSTPEDNSAETENANVRPTLQGKWFADPLFAKRSDR